MRKVIPSRTKECPESFSIEVHFPHNKTKLRKKSRYVKQKLKVIHRHFFEYNDKAVSVHSLLADRLPAAAGHRAAVVVLMILLLVVVVVYGTNRNTRCAVIYLLGIVVLMLSVFLYYVDYSKM